MQIEHGNTGNQYAKKDEAKTSTIHIRCKQSEKSEIVRALKDKEKLTDFVINAALEKARQREHTK